MEFRKFDNKCWWCKGENLSREHKYKKTDIEREYFSKNEEDATAKIVLCEISNLSKKGKHLQSPKSKAIKFGANLCQNCNNSLSQEFDKSYDKFIKFLIKKEEHTLTYNQILFESIYDSEWKVEKENLIKYFIKNLGCALSDADISVPKNLIDFLNKEAVIPHIQIVISQSIDRKKYLDFVSKEISNASWIGSSKVEVSYNQKTSEINFFHYELYYRSYSFYIKIDNSFVKFENNFENDLINLIHYREESFDKIIKENWA